MERGGDEIGGRESVGWKREEGGKRGGAEGTVGGWDLPVIWKVMERRGGTLGFCCLWV